MDNSIIEKSVLVHIEMILRKHGIEECLLIFPQRRQKQISISCNHMKPPNVYQTGTPIARLHDMCRAELSKLLQG